MEDDSKPVVILVDEGPTEGEEEIVFRVLWTQDGPDVVERQLVIGGRKRRVKIVLLDDEDDDPTPEHNPHPPPSSRDKCPKCGHKL